MSGIIKGISGWSVLGLLPSSNPNLKDENKVSVWLDRDMAMEACIIYYICGYIRHMNMYVYIYIYITLYITTYGLVLYKFFVSVGLPFVGICFRTTDFVGQFFLSARSLLWGNSCSLF